MTPHTRPSTMIGAAIDERQPWRRAISAASPEASSYPSTRAGLSVSATSVNTLWPPTAERVPTGTPPGDALQLPIAVAAPSPSYLPTTVMSVSSSLPTSIATASKTSPGGASRATSVATRRSAACSSASRARASRDSALAIAVATSSVNADSRVSASSAHGSRRLVACHERAPESAADEDRRSNRRLQLQVAGKRADLYVLHRRSCLSVPVRGSRGFGQRSCRAREGAASRPARTGLLCSRRRSRSPCRRLGRSPAP